MSTNIFPEFCDVNPVRFGTLMIREEIEVNLEKMVDDWNSLHTQGDESWEKPEFRCCSVCYPKFSSKLDEEFRLAAEFLLEHSKPTF